MMARVPEEVAALLSAPRGERRIAIVGATTARHKYGNIILRDLRAKGFTVVPINPARDEVEGLACHAKVSDAGAVDIVDFVVPPDVSLEVVQELDPEKHRVLWFQPGSFDARVLNAAASFEHVVAGPCIMVEAR
jgi:predicted CoA-binding protein